MQDRQAELVSKALNRLSSFEYSDAWDSNKFKGLREYVKEAISKAFGPESSEFRRIKTDFDIIIFPDDDGYNSKARYDAALAAISTLESIKEIHEEIYSFDPELNKGALRVAHASSKKVFLVHGRDEALLEKTARFQEKAGLIPVVLAEQAGGGDTITEKLERYFDVHSPLYFLRLTIKEGFLVVKSSPVPVRTWFLS